jgi:hypothetical protein
MGYITLPTKDGLPPIVFAREMRIFAILTIILLTITFGCRECWDSPKMRKVWKRCVKKVWESCDVKKAKERIQKRMQKRKQKRGEV